MLNHVVQPERMQILNSELPTHPRQESVTFELSRRRLFLYSLLMLLVARALSIMAELEGAVALEAVLCTSSQGLPC